jgi:YbbR domain-containing protein
MASLREYLRRDGLLLLAALLLAVLVWSYVNDELTETVTVSPRLELQVPEHLTVSQGAPREVTVTLRGTRRSLNAVDAGRLVVRYQLPDRQGPVDVALRSGDFALPPGVEVASYPERFQVQIEKLEKKTVPVRVETFGRLAAGFVVSGTGVPLAEPAEVELHGRREVIEPVAQVLTEPLNLGGKNKSFSTDVRLLAPPEARAKPERVLVFVDVGVEPVECEISGVIVGVPVPGGFDVRVRVEPASITVRLCGPASQVTRLTARDVRAVAEIPELAKPLKAESLDATVRLILPAGVSLVPGAAVPKVRVQISEK